MSEQNIIKEKERQGLKVFWEIREGNPSSFKDTQSQQIPVENNTKLFKKQIGGDHYVRHKIQPWDIILEYKLDFFEGNCLKYLLRRKGSRLEDLEKAMHYLEQCIINEKNKESTNV